MEIREAMEKADATLAAETTTTPVPEVVETTATEAAPVETVTTETTTETRTAAERARDEKGRFAKAAAEAEGKPAAAPKGDANGAAAAAPSAGEGKGDGAATPTAPPPKPDEPVFRAPQSLRPVAREKWASVPREVQEDIIRREKETSQALQHAAEARKEADLFRQVVQPYEQMIRASGATHPLQAVQNLLATANVLRGGTPTEKAQMAARIVKDFGIDIESLAAALDGQPVQGRSAPQIDPSVIAQQAEARIMANLRQQAQQAAAQRNGAMLQRFAESHEFFEDVRQSMADILAARGVNQPTEQQLGEVYDLACRYHPDISGVVKQREAAKAAETAKAATQRTLAAASSVKSTPAAAPARSAQPKGIREALEAADAALAGRV